jgi:hypothetical protein
MPEQQEYAGDLISLQGLKSAINQVFRVFFKAIDFLGYSVKKHLLAVFAFTLSGLGISYLYYIASPSYYAVEMIVMHNDLPRRTYHEIINNLNSLLISDSYPRFASELQISENAARKIITLETKNLFGVPLAKDTTTRAGQPFKIAAKLRKSDVADTLQNALINYLNSNPYIKRIKEGLERINEQRLLFIQSELNKLDSLKASYNQFLQSSKGPATFYNNAINPAEIYVQSNSLVNQRDSILKWKNYASSAILLIDSVKSTSKPKTLFLPLVLLIGITSGLLLGILWALLKTLKQSVSSK